MKIRVRQSKAGERYTTIPSDPAKPPVMVEVRMDANRWAAAGEVARWEDKARGVVFMSLVGTDGRRSEDYFAMPMVAWVRDGFRRPGVAGRRGPAPREGEWEWTGWAWRHQVAMETLMSAAAVACGPALPMANYFRVSHLGKTLMVVSRRGAIGFPEKPAGPLGDYPAMAAAASKWPRHRINLAGVMAANRWDEMMGLVTRHLETARRLLDARANRGVA